MTTPFLWYSHCISWRQDTSKSRLKTVVPLFPVPPSPFQGDALDPQQPWRDLMKGSMGIISTLGAFGNNDFMYKASKRAWHGGRIQGGSAGPLPLICLFCNVGPCMVQCCGMFKGPQAQHRKVTIQSVLVWCAGEKGEVPFRALTAYCSVLVIEWGHCDS